MRRHTITCCLIAAVVLALGAPAMAQNAPKADIALSYSVLYDRELATAVPGHSGFLPVGWVAAVSARVTGPLSVVAEVGANYTTATVEGFTYNRHMYSYLGGVKYTARANPKASPFFQLLAGVGQYSTSVLDSSHSTYGFASQIGGGVDIAATKKAAIRLQADYRLIRVRGNYANQFRFATGIVYRF